MYLKPVLVFLMVVYGSLSFAMEGEEVTTLVATSKRMYWPRGTPDCIAAIPLDKNRAGLERQYERIATPQKAACSNALSSTSKFLRLSSSKGFSYATTDTLISSLALIGNEGYVPAFIRLSELFREGLYSIPQNTFFARQLLDLVPLDEEVVDFFDLDSVRFLLQDLRKRRHLGVPEIARALGVEEPTLDRFIGGAKPLEVLEKFKINCSNLIPLGFYLGDAEEMVGSTEESKESPSGGLRKRK